MIININYLHQSIIITLEISINHIFQFIYFTMYIFGIIVYKCDIKSQNISDKNKVYIKFIDVYQFIIEVAIPNVSLF